MTLQLLAVAAFFTSDSLITEMLIRNSLNCTPQVLNSNLCLTATFLTPGDSLLSSEKLFYSKYSALIFTYCKRHEKTKIKTLAIYSLVRQTFL
jgi:hypothetical protein